MEEIECKITEFFSYLPKFLKEWTALLKECEPILFSLKNQSEQYRLIKRCNWSKELIEKFPDIRTRLYHKITVELEEEVSQLKEHCATLIAFKNELSAKYTAIDRCCYLLNDGGGNLPEDIPIYEVIKYIIDIVRYFIVLCFNVTFSSCSIDFFDETSIQNALETWRAAAVIEDSITEHMEKWKALQKRKNDVQAVNTLLVDDLKDMSIK